MLSKHNSISQFTFIITFIILLNNYNIINLWYRLIPSFYTTTKVSRCENLIPSDEDKVSSLNSEIIESDNLSDTKSVTPLVTCSNLSR